MTTRGVNGPWYALLMSEGPPERVVIRGVKPELECGRFPVKRVLGETVAVDLQIGAELRNAAGERAMGADARKLQHAARHLRIEDVDDRLAALASRYAERSRASHYRELRVTVDPIRARFSTWYEMFPRSCGTFKDCERIIPEVAEMGFDVLYFPPIHPIGRTHR